MTTTYTKVAKVINTAYSNVSSGGGSTYDDAFDIYDSATDTYDGGAVSYTKITKVTGTTYTKVPKPT